jgi:Rps23 Pro-64 3,4-dihydroxylase Tpa1-like proline 4-hydroxylase
VIGTVASVNERRGGAAIDVSRFAFDRRRLQHLAVSHRDAYRVASPFQHAVIDGLVPDEVLERVLAEFPEPSDEWRHFNDAKQRKFGASLVDVAVGPATRNVLAEFNSSAFVDFLQTLTGIEEALIPDPHYRGGGLHQIPPGGYLEVHADFNQHPMFGLDRRVNVLVFLNHGWRSDWGGQLELWDRTMTRAERRVEPTFNRTVIFSITDTAFHGHPEPLQCPTGHARRSLAFYYYSNGRPERERSESHSTLWQTRPTQDAVP